MNTSKTYRLIRKAILLMVVVLPNFCCNVRNRNPQTITRKVKDTKMLPPTRVVIKNPKVTLLDTCPKPFKITVPAPVQAKAGEGNEGKDNATSRKILPPSVKDANFYFHLKNYNTAQGLALSSVRCCLKDHLGNLWFGTYGGGVSRFDGKSFTNYTMDNGLPDNYIFCIYEDGKDNLWFGTEGGGVVRYDGTKFVNYDHSCGLTDNSVLSIAKDRSGKLWIGTAKGVCYCNPDVKQGEKLIFTTPAVLRELGTQIISCMVQDNLGNMWFGTDDEGAISYNNKSLTRYGTEQGLLSNDVESLLCDKDGRIWIGTGKGLNSISGRYFTSYENVGMGTNTKVTYIFQDNADNLWFGTSGGGASFLSRKSLSGNKAIFVNYTKSQGLAGNLAWCIAEDNDYNIWIGYNGEGVDCFPGCQVGNSQTSAPDCKPICSTFDDSDGHTNYLITSILENEHGNLWISTDGLGLMKFNGKSIENYGSMQSFPESTILCLDKGNNGDIWFGLPGGKLGFFNDGDAAKNGTTFSIFTSKHGLQPHSIYYIYNDSKGNIWCCTYGGGVSKFDGKSFTTYTTGQGLANNLVLGMTEDNNGNLWFCTYGGGVSKYDGTSFTNYTTAQGLANNKVNRVLNDKYGNLWFCTYGSGVSRFDGKSFLTFNTSNGLSDNMVTEMVDDKDGRIFFGTNKGISVLTQFDSPPAFNELKTIKTVPAANNITNDELKQYRPEIEIYNEQNGYPIKDIYYTQNSLFMDSQGVLWASNGDTKMGLVRFDYKHIRKDTNSPKIVIKDVKINDEKVCWYSLQKELTDNNSEGGSTTSSDSAMVTQQELMTYGKMLSNKEKDTFRKKFAGVHFDSITPFYPLPLGLILPYNNNRITFDFAAIEPAKSFLVKYRYMLDGYDQSWSPVTDNTEAGFGNIADGKYTFKVQAQSPDGIWSEPVLFTFSVLPPWYRTWWAYGCYAIMAFLILYLIFRWRTATLRKEKYQLEQKVRYRTSEVVKQKQLVEEKNKDILDSISYAKRLQDAILPPVSLIKQYFPDSFVMYKPKDIVAGDFYWMDASPINLPTSPIPIAIGTEISPLGGGGAVLIAACDCTGHGVPGAMVSVVCSNALNRAVKEFKITDPGKVLDKVRELVLETFSQKNTPEEKIGGNIQDGMDVSLALVKQSGGGITIQWAGANNPLWYEHNGELMEIAPDKQPVGKTDNPKPFITHTIQIPPSGGGGAFYLFTDGFADQFGGPKGKKFKYKQFQELLKAIANKSMEEQKNILEEKFRDWKGNLDQIDDILIIGIKI